MLSYIRRELLTDLEGQSSSNLVDDDENVSRRKQYDKVRDEELPIQSGEYYCYRSKREVVEYNINLVKFTLGENSYDSTDEEVKLSEQEYSANATLQGISFEKLNLRFQIEAIGDSPSISGRVITRLSDVIFSRKKNAQGTYIVSSQDELQTEDVYTIVDILSASDHTYSANNVKISLSNVCYEYDNKYETSDRKLSYINSKPSCEEAAENITQAKNTKNMTNMNAKTIINEQEDGYWKTITETTSILLKFSLEGQGVMGGAFKNHLVSSSFKKIEEQYSYERDGETVNAVTITYPKPTAKAGQYSSNALQTSYNGQFAVLQPGDYIDVWYSEDKWQINNAIYMKNVQTDSQANGNFYTLSTELIFRMNYIPALATINNNSGMIDYRIVSCGAAQMDASSYTGLSILFRFLCEAPTEKRYFTEDTIVPQTFPYIYAASIGREVRLQGNNMVIPAQSAIGYGSGYPKQTKEHRMTISYTVLKPSDPEFVTGGSNYAESITTELYDIVRDLQQQINDIKADINIQGVISSVFEAITNFPEFMQLFKGFTKIFKQKKEALRVLQKRKKNDVQEDIDLQYAELLSETNIDRALNIENVELLPEEFSMAIVHNTYRRALSKDIDAFVIASSYKPTVYTKPEIVRKYVKDDIKNLHIAEVDPTKRVINMLTDKAEILTYKVDKAVMENILSEISTTRNRSLFSLNMRKQIAVKNEFSSYGDLLHRMMNDKELIDITNSLSNIELEEIFMEIYERLVLHLQNF
uniref:VP4 n=1 Tax=Rotavirus G pigeon/HK18 TaxID=1399970 RepID=U3R5W5_9REOV|nr:VP4 [Rotavirus G pigeon/HK18]WQF62275.1 MAG: VP4 protein [Rotavirus G]